MTPQLDDKLPSLEDQGIERLVPQSLNVDDADKEGKHIDRAFELKRLVKSLLLKFLELVGTLSIAPEQASILSSLPALHGWMLPPLPWWALLTI